MGVVWGTKHFIRRKFQKSTKLLICLENVDPGWAGGCHECGVLGQTFKCLDNVEGNKIFHRCRVQYKSDASLLNSKSENPEREV